MIKNSKRLFIKSLCISLVVAFCLISGFYGMAKAYENIRRTGFGEYRKAIEINDGTIRIFDFEIDLKK